MFIVENTSQYHYSTDVNLYITKTHPMQASSAISFLPKLTYVDYREIESSRYSPGALTLRQFEVYVEYLAKGVGREEARRLAVNTPKR